MGMLRPNSPSRCQHVEGRWLNERNGRNPNSAGTRHWDYVQCGLRKNHDGLCSHSGRKFGAPSAPSKPTNHWKTRCHATEERQITSGATIIARCRLKKNHQGEHTAYQRKFGQPLKKRNRSHRKDYDLVN